MVKGIFPREKTKIIKAKYVFYGPCKPSDISKGGYVLDDSVYKSIINWRDTNSCVDFRLRF